MKRNGAFIYFSSVKNFKYLLCMDTYICNKIIMKDRRMMNANFRLTTTSRREAEKGALGGGRRL